MTGIRSSPPMKMCTTKTALTVSGQADGTGGDFLRLLGPAPRDRGSHFTAGFGEDRRDALDAQRGIGS